MTSDYHGKITSTVRDATEALHDDDTGVLSILRTPTFNLTGRDSCHAEYITVDGEYGQVCTGLRDRRFYVRGPHAHRTDADDSVRFHQTIESALSEAMGRIS
ncbi:hypothetical protein E1264_35165 [Actinomadura sp. KC216]|uniref:hypothetical protein n=1 Tax=Actinomadura sp. KC216 TaxID=2530370 RepID=UPI00104C357E|nr:hypothetical protein [Actinomadura sp. KC216]TDB79717.1 hypothetical protein E1264_35165 [Actinomadura sp. KC216]